MYRYTHKHVWSEIHEDFRVILKELQPEIKGWRSTVDGQTQDIQNQRYIDETEGLLTVVFILKKVIITRS